MPRSGHRLGHFLKEVRRRRVVQVAAAYIAAGWIVIEASATITPELPLPEWTPRAVILVVLFGFPVALFLSWVFDITPRGVRRTESLETLLSRLVRRDMPVPNVSPAPRELRPSRHKGRSELQGLFEELAATGPAAREARLREIGARDGALRARLEAMLAADAEATDRLRDHEAAVARSFAAATERSDGDPLGLLGMRVGRYRVDALLGAGGMGVVYRAADARLGRAAALKFLPPAWSLDERAKQRFLHEARAASSLDHPNVCTIYEADETADGTPYIAMAYYEGETLRDRLEHEPLAVEEALDLAAQAACGLAAAHTRGMVHRDIKPANLLVTSDGALKILDFGVAKAADIGLTLPEQRPGTAAYMAPEQARGDAVDGRADLWSLGVVLYEMLTGARPAAAGHPTESPPPLSTLRAAVPPWLDALVLDLLAYDPQDRPDRAEDVLAALREHGLTPRTGAWLKVRRARGRAVSYVGVAALIAVVAVGSYAYLQGGAAPGAPAQAAAASPRFLAVLPFDNRSADAENEYFADGITDDVLAHLAQVPDFSVISRTTTMGYKNTEKSIREIADEIGVEYVLAGSVQRAGEQVHITAHLVDGRTDRYLWADTYQRRLEDVFAVQTEIARAIARALEVELSGSVASRMERSQTSDMQAYDLFLAGRASVYRYDMAANEHAIELFRRALDRDPEFTLARAWLGLAYAHSELLFGNGREWADSALVEADRAISEQHDLADAYGARGDAYLAVGRHVHAVQAYERALQLNPSDWHAAVSLGAALEFQNQWDEAIRLSRRSLELDPVRSYLAYAFLARYYANLGLHERADTAIARAMAVEPDDPDVIFAQGYLDLLNGRHDAALLAADRLAGFSGDNSLAAQYAAQLFVWAGEIERAKDAAAAAYARSPTTSRVYVTGVVYSYTLDRTGAAARADSILADAEAFIREQIDAGGAGAQFQHSLAVIHALRGEQDEAFRWLNAAVRSGWNQAALLPHNDPLLEGLHDDPRFQAELDLMERNLASMRRRVERDGL